MFIFNVHDLTFDIGTEWEGCWAEDQRSRPRFNMCKSETRLDIWRDLVCGDRNRYFKSQWCFPHLHLVVSCDVSKVSTVSASGRVCIQMFHKSFRFSRKEQSLDGSGYTAGGVDYPVSVVYPPQKKRHNRTTSLCVRGGLPSPLCLFLLHFITFSLHR